MTIVELYINNRLCDTAADFRVRLNRQLLKPGEMNTKDAQYSYSITLPPTANNHEVFNYSNIEETRDKFNWEYRAELIINSVRVFKGLFRMSAITRSYYKGNLYIPAVKSIKDIFGEIKLNENPPYPLTFGDFAESISGYNRNAARVIQKAIFPYTLYGLLPKYPADSDTPRGTWDNTVHIGIQDFPPSINVLKLLKEIFKGQGYHIDGSAFNDDRLSRLYMSYKNESDYQQEWNWGDLAKVTVNGTWAIADNDGRNYQNFERQIDLNEDEYGGYYTVNLLNSNKVNLSYVDKGSNVLYTEYTDKYHDKDYVRKSMLVTIPKSGYYKVRLTCSEFLLNRQGEHLRYWDNGNKFTSTSQSHANRNNRFDRSRYEIQVLRDFGEGEFHNTNIVGFYNRPQFAQNSFDDKSQFPKYYPMPSGAMVIDPSVNENFICGLRWGRHENDYNPQDNTDKCNYMFIANGFSWDKSFTQRKKILSAYSSWNGNETGNYFCWGTSDIESEEPIEEDLPNPDWLSNPVKRRYGRVNNFNDSINYVRQNGNDTGGEGRVECVVWLEKGENITIGIAGDMGDMRRGSSHHTEFDQWIVLIDSVKFRLDIEPFRTESEWDNFNNKGSYNPESLLNWNDTVNFQKNEIDLIKFLPADMKTDDFIDNVCKAFNLKLTQTGVTTFSLDVKQSKKVVSNLFINLDNLASVHDRSNTPLGLPSLYKLGFTIDQEEEGYVESIDPQTGIGDDGGGEYSTGVTEEKIIEQKSNFSYNWFKDITKGAVVLPLAIISKHEAWKDEKIYTDAMMKRYTNQALRFWYYDGLLNDLGATFDFNGKALSIAKVSNELPGLSVLNYKNQRITILDNYFTLLIDGGSHYTEVEGYLTPDQYEALNGAIMAMFNGDLYYVAELSGYDPMGRNKTKIKLIRKI